MSLLMHSNKRDTMGFPISVLCSIVTIAIECAVFDPRDRQTDVWTYLTVLPLSPIWASETTSCSGRETIVSIVYNTAKIEI